MNWDKSEKHGPTNTRKDAVEKQTESRGWASPCVNHLDRGGSSATHKSGRLIYNSEWNVTLAMKKLKPFDPTDVIFLCNIWKMLFFWTDAPSCYQSAVRLIPCRW